MSANHPEFHQNRLFFDFCIAAVQKRANPVNLKKRCRLDQYFVAKIRFDTAENVEKSAPMSRSYWTKPYLNAEYIVRA